MLYIHVAQMGDRSGDGHEKSESITFVSNYETGELWSSYLRGSEILGFDIIENHCCEYESSTLPQNIIDTLVAHGIVIKDYNYFKEGAPLELITEEHNFSTEQWFKLFIEIVKLGSGLIEKEFSYTIYEATPMDIGGYGLFS